jgi:hypothetical protein
MKLRILLFELIIIGLSLTAFTLIPAQQKSGTHEVDPAVKTEVYRVLDAYLATFNARDLKGWEATYHFPHYRLASGTMNVLDKAGLRDPTKVFAPLEKEGWHHSVWEHRNIIQASDTKVHVDTQFTRFRKDGSKLGVYESLYVLTKEEGRWGVKLRSSYAE